MLQDKYDVVICGGGVAGQTLARQLKLTHSDLSILLLDRNKFPVREAAHKVGESTVEVAADYLSSDLQLHEYLQTHHIVKLGLRFFWKSSSNEQCFSERSELGLSHFPVINSYQLDIGRLENDLWEMNRSAGIQVAEQTIVNNIIIHDGQQPNEVHLRQKDSDCAQIVRARWVIDAMGRPRFLQRKLGLGTDNGEVRSSVWFRVKGKVDLADLVPKTHTEWHERVPDDNRWRSTVHLMGPGYWVWLIPLASGYTSIGIVAREEIHPFLTYHTPELAREWLDKHEFLVSRYIQEFEMIDFLKLRNYSFASKQVFSSQGWACIGNSAVFPDPFISPGSVLISRENNFLTQMIGMDKAGQLNEETVAMYNDTVLNMNTGITQHLHEYYTYASNKLVFSLAFLFNIPLNWGIGVPIKQHALYLDKDKNTRINKILADTRILIGVMDNLFVEWGKKSQGRFDFDFIDYLSPPFMKEIADLQTRKNLSMEQLESDFHWMGEKVEELAQVVFMIIVEDCMPEQLGRIQDTHWINAWAISLNPELWEKDGLFAPKSEPRDLKSMYSQVRSLYKNQNYLNR